MSRHHSSRSLEVDHYGFKRSNIKRAGGQYKDDIYRKINSECGVHCLRDNCIFFFLLEIVIDLKYLSLFLCCLFFTIWPTFCDLYKNDYKQVIII